MKTVILIAVSVLTGAGVMCLYYRRTIKLLRKKVAALKGENGETHGKHIETMKLIVLACELNGFAWVWFSYILAAMDKTQIAEDLSKVAVVEIIAPVLVYAGKSVIENLSKYNHWPDKQPAAAPEDSSEPLGESLG